MMSRMELALQKRMDFLESELEHHALLFSKIFKETETLRRRLSRHKQQQH